MNDIFSSLIASSPSAVAVIVVTKLFLAEIRIQRTEYFTESQQRLQALQSMSHDMNNVVKENTTQLARVGLALEKCAECRKVQQQQ